MYLLEMLQQIVSSGFSMTCTAIKCTEREPLCHRQPCIFRFTILSYTEKLLDSMKAGSVILN